MNKLTHKKSQKWKKFIFPVCVYVIGIFVFTGVNYERTKSNLLSGIDRNLFIAAQCIKNTLPSDFHDRALNFNSINKTEDWKNIKALSKLAYITKINFLYTIVIKNGKAYFTSCSTTSDELKNHNEVHYWLEYAEASKALLNIPISRKTVYETTSNRWGTFRSAVIPIISQTGNLYLVGSCYKISYITLILHKEVVISVIFALFLSFLVIPFAYYMLKMQKNYSYFLHTKVQERTVQLSHEISERKRAQEQLTESLAKSEELAEKAQEANKAKSEFLATMSHEIRTPLNVIIGMSALLNNPAISQEQAEYLGTIKGASEHLLNIIDNILDFSQIEANKVNIENVKFDINELVNYSVNSFMNLAKYKEIGLKSLINEKVPKFITGDPSYLRQILFNLLSNAVKFTEKGEVSLFIYLNKYDNNTNKVELLFKITDSGIGIPVEKEKIIFDKFSQADSSTRRKYGGTGLGLAICKHLVSILDGKIWFESKAGHGSTFYFTLNFGLPGLELSGKNSKPDEYKVDDNYKLRNLNILLAEDNLLNVKVTKSFLQKSGHTVTVVSNGNEVMQKIKDNSYDLILMDIEMPEMDGIEAAQLIREGGSNVKNKNIPIIALTAHALDEIKDKCKYAGMNHFITKPIDFKKLDFAMTQVLHFSIREKSPSGNGNGTNIRKMNNEQ